MSSVQRASLILSQLPPDEARQLIWRIDPVHRRRMAVRSEPPAGWNTRDTIREFLSDAAHLTGDCDSPTLPARLMNALESRRIASMLVGEWPPTIAAVLTFLRPERKREVLAAMPAHIREEVQRIEQPRPMDALFAERIVQRMVERVERLRGGASMLNRKGSWKTMGAE